jgi:hypothetical protein
MWLVVVDVEQNETCMAQTGETMRLLSRTPTTPRVFNTGAVMADIIFAVLGMLFHPIVTSHHIIDIA